MPPPSPFLERLIRLLLPFFLGVCPDLDSARAEILETLASYGAQTRAQLLNAAQIIAFGLAALDMLHEAKTTDMSPSMRLRFRGCANNLNRSSKQNEQTLTKRLACDDPQAAGDEVTEAEFHEKLLQVHATLAANGVHLPLPFPLTESHTPNGPRPAAMMQTAP
jgi:hypothetical protein